MFILLIKYEVKMKAKELLKETTDKVINLMKTQGTDWVKPWAVKMGNELPINYTTQKHYTGFNTFQLSMSALDSGYEHNKWATYKQWAGLGHQIKKGEKSTPIFYWDKLLVNDDSGILDSKGQPLKKNIWFVKYYRVFNADQVEGLKLPTKGKDYSKFETFSNKLCEQFVANTKANIQYKGGVACYKRQLDYIQIPTKESFIGSDTSTAEESFYSTLLHELIHWSGSESRLKRIKGDSFGDDKYAFEELVAETGSALLCSLLNVSVEPRPDHAKYLNNWIKQLEKDPKVILKAFSQSYKAVDYLQNLQTKKLKRVA